MKELVIASNNTHKIQEIREILKEKFDRIYSLNELEIDCDPDETGETFIANAVIKAVAVSKFTDKAVLADDTGLCVNALGGLPGVHSARFAGNHDDAANRKKLLSCVQDKTDRTAYFATAVALLLPDGKLITAEGKTDGEILNGEKGGNGFGYDCLFFSYKLKKSFGEATEEEKNSVSHRADALKNLIKTMNGAS